MLAFVEWFLAFGAVEEHRFKELNG